MRSMPNYFTFGVQPLTLRCSVNFMCSVFVRHVSSACPLVKCGPHGAARMDPLPRRQLPQQSPRPPRVPFSSTFYSRASTPHSVSGRLTPHRPIGQWTQSEQQFFDKPVSYECEKGLRVGILGLEPKKTRLRASQKTKGLRRVA